MPKISEVLAFLERFAPLNLAAEWDNVGLLLGDANRDCERILTCLSISPLVVQEAIAERANLIVSHHPVLFRGTKKLSSTSSDGRLLLPLLEAKIAVYSPHTAFDNCVGGINDGIADRLKLQQVRPLRNREGVRAFKLVVFVPEADLEKVSQALFAAGAGRIGNYEQCSFRTQGTGTFFGNEFTNPTIGTKGQREEVNELRLEVIVPEQQLTAVIQAMRSAHSYEEPAFDVYPLKALPGGGEGRFGILPEPVALSEFAEEVRQCLKANIVQYVGDAKRKISRIAVACGAAGEYLNDAKRAKADVFLTGEVRFHDCLNAEQSEIALVLPGHYATERPGIEDLAKRLETVFASCKVWPSAREADPLVS